MAVAVDGDGAGVVVVAAAAAAADVAGADVGLTVLRMQERAREDSSHLGS